MCRLSASATRVQQALTKAGLSLEVVELPSSTRTAAEAAEAVGCKLEQIAKTIVFRGVSSGRAVLVVASGSNRICERTMAELVGEPVAMATPEFVRQATGFVIGGVAPCGHPRRLEIFLDQDLFGFAEIWAAAGTPNALFRLQPGELERLTSGTVAAVC